MEVDRGAHAGRLMGLLNDILDEKRREIAALRQAPPAPRPSDWALRDVLATLRRPAGGPLRLISEIKFRSPSAGALSRKLTAPERARAYEEAGASMVSVLADTRWFDGSYEHIEQVRGVARIPILCKDYLIDPLQLARAHASGADAALLIVRCVPDGAALGELVREALSLGLEPFVEVVDEDELERALAAGARLVGVNARDLDTLHMDAARAARVLARIPSHVVAVHLSGLRTPGDASHIATSRADAALIGEALMRQDEPRALLAELVAGARGEK